MQRKLVVFVVLAAMLFTTVGGAFADVPTQRGTEQIECYPWYDGGGLWWGPNPSTGIPELKSWPFAYGGFNTASTWRDDLDRMLGMTASLLMPITDPDGAPAIFWPIDMYLWRPPTLYLCYDFDADEWIWPGDPAHPNADGGKYWPFVWNAQRADTWFKSAWDNPDGPRRQSWPTFQMTDEFGWYTGRFMLPRDEVWYPCGYPCKWDCNFYNTLTDTYTFHSPNQLFFVYPEDAAEFEPLQFPLYWPWTWDAFWGAVPIAEQEDTVHPITLWVVEGVFNSFVNFVGSPPWGEYEITGYFWKTSDLQGKPWPQDYPLLCEDHLWYPTQP
jgi:hypothetical protein